MKIFWEQAPKHDFPLCLCWILCRENSPVFLSRWILQRCSRLQGRQRRAWGAVAPQWLLTSWFCVNGHFLRSQETLILETDFLWRSIWAKAQLQPACTQTEEEGVGREGQLWNSSASSSRVWGISLHYFPFLWPHIFPLSRSLSSPFLRLRGYLLTFHCWVLFGFSNVNTQEPDGVEECRRLGGTVGVHAVPGLKHKYRMRHTITARF